MLKTYMQSQQSSEENLLCVWHPQTHRAEETSRSPALWGNTRSELAPQAVKSVRQKRTLISFNMNIWEFMQNQTHKYRGIKYSDHYHQQLISWFEGVHLYSSCHLTSGWWNSGKSFWRATVMWSGLWAFSRMSANASLDVPSDQRPFYFLCKVVFII